MEAVAIGPPPSFDELYEGYVDFVWRCLRRFGVVESAVDDAVQEVFIVVHRRLPEFEARSSVKTWLGGIAFNVARDHHRWTRRKGTAEQLPDDLVHSAPSPHEQAEKNEALAIVDRLLDQLDKDKRAVFVLADIEQLTAPEIAEALSVNVNTIYSRIRVARRSFEDALVRYRKQQEAAP